ncbi:P-loop containing nucleoside triphosphate hydrolases superfamily protein [Euphorbia peplus]|nr:P-loop containing nucleoside triphosphate hydrolases superfamily protein [Euphorbia peplus]
MYYSRLIRVRNPKLGSVITPSKPSKHHGDIQSFHHSTGSHSSNISLIRRHLSYPFSRRGGKVDSLPIKWLNTTQLCFYSSESGGRNTGKTLTPTGLSKREGSHVDAHARLAEQDQKEWLNNEKLALENQKKESPFLSRRERFKNEFLRRIVPWERIHVSWENFPYYVNEHTKSVLVECVSSHLKNKKCSVSYGARLSSSSGRILLQSVPGTELYRERIVRALARDLQVPLLVLDGSVFASYDFADDGSSECESDDNAESECTSESEVEDENHASNEEEWTSSGEAKTDCSDDDVAAAEAKAEAALKKLIPFNLNLEEFAKRVSGESDSSTETSTSEVAESSDTSERPLKKGDRVKYIGRSKLIEADNRVFLPMGQRGEVYEVDGDRVFVILDITKDTEENEKKDEKPTDQLVVPPVCWVDAKDIERDSDVEAEDCYIAMETLCEVLQAMQHPLIVYFQDSSPWLSRAVPKSNRKDFVDKVQEMFDRLSGPVILICGQNKVETGSKEKENITMLLPSFGRLAAKLPLSLKHLGDGLRGPRRSEDTDIYKLFTNVLTIQPPKEEDQLRTFNKHIEEDRKIVISRSNLNELYKVLEENEMSCLDLLQVNSDGVELTKQKAEKVVGWAKNHYLSSCEHPSIKGERLILPRKSLDIAIGRLKEQETISQKSSLNLKNLAKDEYESNFVSAVVPPGEIGVKFDDVGALEEVKKALNELVILPMKRPELFSRGNLLRPCKGILLFGPPGTGKTLLAKALATEASANFMSITGSTLTSKWFGDAEKLTKALFSFASKLAPVIIFVDEIDSLLGARGGAFEHEATRRMRNEFMAAWDGLRTKDSQRILILGATNRPFDLDDAVIRRLPRRIYVDLPDVENRMKILNIYLSQEILEPNFEFDKLANATEGYSGSDLKNLCIAAAYRPVQELLEEEKKSGKEDVLRGIRPLSLDDFIQSKAKVGPSVAFDAASMNELRKWNEQYGEGGSRRKSPFGF